MLKNGQARKARATSSEAMTSRVGEMAIASARMASDATSPTTTAPAAVPCATS